MTLEEGIIHAEDVARMNHEAAKHLTDEHPTQAEKCEECAKEHRQLAEWLKELKAYKEQSGDAISRQAVLNAMYELCDTGETLKENPWRDNPHIDGVVEAIEELPSITPQQKLGRCKDCKYFEYDSVAKVDGIPLIVAHEICSKWGDGCKTKEDGYCFLFESQESEVEE